MKTLSYILEMILILEHFVDAHFVTSSFQQRYRERSMKKMFQINKTSMEKADNYSETILVVYLQTCQSTVKLRLFLKIIIMAGWFINVAL